MTPLKFVPGIFVHHIEDDGALYEMMFVDMKEQKLINNLNWCDDTSGLTKCLQEDILEL